MLFPTSLLILVACVAIVGRGAHTVVYFRRQKALKEKLGCQPLQNRFVFEYLHGFVLFLESYLSLRRHRFLDNSRERFKLHGATYKTNMLGENVIFTIDPENIKAVLATNFSDYSLGDRRKGALTHIFGYGIITTDAAAWSHFRKLSLRSFSQQALTNLTILDEHVSLLLKLIPGDGSTVDLRPLFFNMMLEITSKTFCGEAISCLDSEGSITAQGFSEAFDDSQRSLRNALYFGRLSLWGPFTTFRRNQEYIHRFMNGITAKATATYKSIDPDYDPLIEKPQWKPGQYGKDVFKDTKDHHIVQAALTQAFLGGRDTTSGLLTNLWFVLARRLDVWKRLQSEIAFLQGEKPTIKQLKEIEYLRWFINEGSLGFPHCGNHLLTVYRVAAISTCSCEPSSSDKGHSTASWRRARWGSSDSGSGGHNCRLPFV